MYPNQYQNQYQYPNQFGGFQNHVIEPPMPTKKNGSSGNGFWLGFIGGILTAIIIGVGIELFKRFRAIRQPSSQPLPNPAKEKAIEESNIKTIAEEIPNVNFFEISKPAAKQTFEDFLTFLQTQGFWTDEDANDVTGKEVWIDEHGNEIHFGSFDFTIKSPTANPVTISKKDALFLETNTNILKYFSNENQN